MLAAPRDQTATAIDARLLALLTVGLALAYAGVSALSTGAGAIHEDMAEAYVWGSHFEWGYYKHPPLWAWIAGGWFELMPRSALSFALLCAANVAIGLWGAWMLIGRFARGWTRLAGFLLLLLTPLYGLNAFVFNANSIFISLWPWTAWAFVRAMDERGFKTALMFGLFAGLDMLAKYYAVVLLGACVLAALAHPKAKAYFASPWPYLSVAVASLVFAPHVVWLLRTGFLPFHYFGGESGHGLGYSLGTAVKLFAGDVALMGVVIALVLVASWTSLGGLPARLRERAADRRFRVLLILGLAPLLATLIFGLIFRLKLSTNWTIAVFPVVPLILIELADPPDRRRLAVIAGVLAVIAAAAGLAIAPLAKDFSREAKDREPRRDIVAAAVQLWRDHTQVPLSVVGGDETYGDAAGFYAPGKPSVFIRFDPTISPWIDVGALPRTGLLAICPANGRACLAGAWRYSSATTTWMRFDLPGHGPKASGAAARYGFVVAVTPPDPTARP
ncbi:MAG TPA: glycosyltransferase family 39 protein [Caulobacteraceae bacterium]|nr:glycosyltransferase family 39 protein [Caulobacteraceae bacterium]